MVLHIRAISPLTKPGLSNRASLPYPGSIFMMEGILLCICNLLSLVVRALGERIHMMHNLTAPLSDIHRPLSRVVVGTPFERSMMENVPLRILKVKTFYDLTL